MSLGVGIVASAASDAPLTLTLMTGITATNSGSSTITIPATANVGDIAIFTQYAYQSGGTPTTKEFSGATTVNNVAGGPGTVRRIMVSLKVLTSGDINTPLTGMSATGTYKTVRIVRPSRAVSNITAGSAFGRITNTSFLDTILVPPAYPAILFGRTFSELTLSPQGTLVSNSYRLNENSDADFATWLEVQNGPTMSSRTIGLNASTGVVGGQGFYAVIT